MEKLLLVDLKYYKDKILLENLYFLLRLHTQLEIYALLVLPFFFLILCGLVFFVFNLMLIKNIFTSYQGTLQNKFRLCALIFLNNFVQLFELSLTTLLHENTLLENPGLIDNSALDHEHLDQPIDRTISHNYYDSFIESIFSTKTFFKW